MIRDRVTRLADDPGTKKRSRAPSPCCKRFAPLSHRERDVLKLLPLGYTNAEIARHLSVGVETVKTHLGRGYEKLGARNRAEAIALFLERERAIEQLREATEGTPLSDMLEQYLAWAEGESSPR